MSGVGRNLRGFSPLYDTQGEDEETKSAQTYDKAFVDHEIYERSIVQWFSGVSAEVNIEDSELAQRNNVSLSYGELTPQALTKLGRRRFLDLRNCSVLFDLGCGVGKLTVQAFAQFDNIKKVVGIEFSRRRFEKGVIALKTNVVDELKMQELEHSKTTYLACRGNRTIELRHGDALSTQDIEDADVVLLMVNIREDHKARAQSLLKRLKKNARFISYTYLMEDDEIRARPKSRDSFSCSWSTAGHAITIWETL
jgi:SAM-dependent methyltransferase